MHACRFAGLVVGIGHGEPAGICLGREAPVGVIGGGERGDARAESVLVVDAGGQTVGFGTGVAVAVGRGSLVDVERRHAAEQVVGVGAGVPGGVLVGIQAAEGVVGTCDVVRSVVALIKLAGSRVVGSRDRRDRSADTCAGDLPTDLTARGVVGGRCRPVVRPVGVDGDPGLAVHVVFRDLAGGQVGEA